MATDDARRVLADARAQRVFPAAVAEVGDSATVLWREAVGTLAFESAVSVDAETPFDLASLTKVIGTASIAMLLLDSRLLELNEPVSTFFSEWRGKDREAVTVRGLMEHSSGLPARLVDPSPEVRREFEHEICTMRLEYEPRTQSVYSDLGFILLGFLLADRGGASLAAQFARIWRDPMLAFDLPAETKRRAAPTLPAEDDVRRGRTLVGEVHDNYAAALGGIAGHAGMFGTAGAVGAFARVVLAAARGTRDGPLPFSRARVAEFVRKSDVPGSSRALAWDTMLPTSSCGTRMSITAFGHVGFTGTSLWIDPVRDRYFVLLTNRACGGGTPEEMRGIRRAFHDALGDV